MVNGTVPTHKLTEVTTQLLMTDLKVFLFFGHKYGELDTLLNCSISASKQTTERSIDQSYLFWAAMRRQTLRHSSASERGKLSVLLGSPIASTMSDSLWGCAGYRTLSEKNVYLPSSRVMSSPFLHKTIFFSESCLCDLMLYVATKFD
jgi:hypothetical protein